MTSAYSINLNFNNTIPVKTDFTFKQGDKGITLNLATTGLDTTGTTAHIVFKRSNGTSVEAELTGQTGPSYSYTILGNEFEIPGVVVADLKLYNGDTQRVSTASFIFLVTGDTMDGVGGGTGGYSDQLEQLSQEFAETLEEYQDAFGDVGAINPRGEYSALEEYTALDLVSYNGSSYLCREGCTGIAPTNTTYWQVFAAGGASPDAEDVNYDNTTSQLTADNVQDALDELAMYKNALRRTRKDITSNLTNLATAVSEQNLEKYGYAIGDYFERTDGARTYTYILAAMNPFKGPETPYCINTNHIGIVVNTHTATTWGSSGNSGYSSSTLHGLLSGTVLTNIKSDMVALFGGSSGLEHLLSQTKLLTTGLSSWAWTATQYISALTESNVYGHRQWSANAYQEGESPSHLELFAKWRWTEIFGADYVWLRNLYTTSDACRTTAAGGTAPTGNNGIAVGLICFY